MLGGGDIETIEMGNVNGREDGGGSPSAAEEESGGGSVQEGHAHGRGVSGGGDGSSELMGQSPPHSPRATHSPLMFTPQVSSFLSSSFVYLFLFKFVFLLFFHGDSDFTPVTSN